MINFFVPCNPAGKGRPRFARCGKFVRTYTPKKTEALEKVIALVANTNRPPEEDMGKPVILDAMFVFEKPKSAKKRVYHIVKPDIDNVLKLLCDSCNGILWNDDNQIITVRASKRYTYFEYSEPGINIKVEYV
jgi:Holliday junction resolvase RusA-like endonuclease